MCAARAMAFACFALFARHDDLYLALYTPDGINIFKHDGDATRRGARVPSGNRTTFPYLETFPKLLEIFPFFRESKHVVWNGIV